MMFAKLAKPAKLALFPSSTFKYAATSTKGSMVSSGCSEIDTRLTLFSEMCRSRKVKCTSAMTILD